LKDLDCLGLAPVFFCLLHWIRSTVRLPPLLRSYPDRPYKVLAEIDAPTTPLALAIGARRTKDMGGNAMIVLVEGDAAGSMALGTGLMAGNAFTGTAVSVPLPVRQARFFAIQWK